MSLPETPQSFVDELCQTVAMGFDAALQLINEQTGEEIKIEHLVIALRLSGLAEDQHDTTVAAFEIEDEKELLSILLTHVARISQQLGLPFSILPINVRGEG